MEPGQMLRGTPIGDLVYETARRPDINIIVEIGTWTGLGSTKCVIEGIKGKEKCRFISIEAWPEKYQQAKINVGVVPNVELVLGCIIKPENIPTFSNLSQFHRDWLNREIGYYKSIPNVLSIIPPKIDFLILDGGEFTSDMEFDLLNERSKYILMDDTNPDSITIKNIHSRQKVLDGLLPFTVIVDNVNERFGWMFLKNNKLD